MTFDSGSIGSGHTLIQRLEAYNPWWERGQEASVTENYSSLQTTFYQIYDNLHQQDQRVVPVTGPDCTGKSALLTQLASAQFDPDFVEKFFRDESRRELAHSQLVAPSSVLYISLRDDPVFQLQPADQIRAAVDHFETHVLWHPHSEPHYILIDDLHTVERPNTRGTQTVGRWEELLAELVAAHDDRRIVFTSLSRGAVRERLEETDIGVGTECPGNTYELYPLGFSEFLRMRYRDIELAPSTERFDGSAVREAFDQAVRNDTAESVIDEIDAQQADAVVDPSTVRREIANYCTSGGLLTLRIAGDGVPIGDQRFLEVLRSRDEVAFSAHQRELLDDFRADLLRAAASLGGLKGPLGLERLCALIAHEHPVGDVPFDDLIGVLDVDRRTLRDKYLNALSRLNLLSAAQEYDNQRPRKLRLYMRDPGLTNAFCRHDLTDVLRREPGLDEALAKAVAFDHTVRLSNECNHPHDPKRGVVKFWSGSSGTVDFVVKLHGTPVPVLWSYSRGLEALEAERETPQFDALLEFLDSDAYSTERDSIDSQSYRPVTDAFSEQRRRYVQQDAYGGALADDGTAAVDGEPVFGVVLTNARSALENGVAVSTDGPKPIIQIPLWTYLRVI